MDSLKSLVSVNSLKTNVLKKFSKTGKPIYFRYDKEVDSLLFMFAHPEETETIVHYVDDNVALLYERRTKEIVGFQIEAFQKSFLARHKNVAKVWKLSEALKEEIPENFGDMILIFEEVKPKVAREIFKSASPLLPHKIANFKPAFADS